MKIGGKNYQKGMTWDSKSTANAMARDYRKSGYSARVTTTTKRIGKRKKKEYTVYYRK